MAKPVRWRFHPLIAGTITPLQLVTKARSIPGAGVSSGNSVMEVRTTSTCRQWSEALFTRKRLFKLHVDGSIHFASVKMAASSAGVMGKKVSWVIMTVKIR